MSNPTDAEILALARRHLDVGLCFDSTARITRATDAELIAFARAALAAQLLALAHEPTPAMLKACDTIIKGYGAKLVRQRMLAAALAGMLAAALAELQQPAPFSQPQEDGLQPNTWANVLLLVNEYAGHVVDASLHQAESRADIARSAALKTLGKLHQAFEARRDPSAQQAPTAAARDAQAERVHAMVDDGPVPAMSRAFDLHMGATAWVDPAYRQDAALWAASWKAALASQQLEGPKP